jgi:hypothetical protein
MYRSNPQTATGNLTWRLVRKQWPKRNMHSSSIFALAALNMRLTSRISRLSQPREPPRKREESEAEPVGQPLLEQRPSPWGSPGSPQLGRTQHEDRLSFKGSWTLKQVEHDEGKSTEVIRCDHRPK